MEAAEYRERLIEKMGKDLGEAFYLLDNDINTLTLKWKNFNELYGSGQANVKLLNDVAPSFFFLVQKVFWENMLLCVGKLIDGATTGFGKKEKKNITLETLINFVDDPDLKEVLVNHLNEIRLKGSFSKDWRNRYIAHSDYDLRLKKEGFKELEISSKNKLIAVLDEIYLFMNKISEYYLDGAYTNYSMLIGLIGAKKLLSYFSTHSNSKND
ncbi:MAG: hypothetical protein Q8K92_06610 [Leadbetterella sp.]|nr:hypothetical protein [Leadbetterella sp.]